MQRRGNTRTNTANPEKEKLIKAAKNLIQTDNAANFFNAAIQFSDPLEALSVIDDIGMDKLTTAYSIAAGNDISLLFRFFEFLGQDKLSAGTTKLIRDMCYTQAFRTPGLLRAIQSSLPDRASNELLILAWFLVAVCRVDFEARTHPIVLEIANELCSSEGPAIRAMVTLILPHSGGKVGSQVSGDSIKNLSHVRALEPQHDNDFPLDYRSIQIIPTAEEINCGNSVPGAAMVPRSGPPDEASILDRQFRLLREDMVAPIIAELLELKTALSPPAMTAGARGIEQLKKRLFRDPVLVDVTVDQFACYVSMLVPIPTQLKVRLEKMSKKERDEFCSIGPGRRILARDSLLLFLKSDMTVCYTGRVVRKDKSDFLRHEGFFSVGLEFSGEHLPEILSSVRFGKVSVSVQVEPSAPAGPPNRNERGEPKPKVDPIPPIVMHENDKFSTFVFQSNSSVFSYEPVLHCLQDMVSIPFREELMCKKPPLPLRNPTPLSAGVRAALAEDLNQLEAVQSALRQRVCLIQGPPGTGKTYVGVQIVRALLDEAAANAEYGQDEQDPSEEVRILCLCYTNHALDDFLLSLHEDGKVPLGDMIRLGRSPKIHEKLKSRTLGDTGESFDRMQKRTFAIAKKAMDTLGKDIQTIKSSIGRESGRWNWSKACAFFEDEAENDPEVEEIYHQFQFPAEGFSVPRPDEMWRQWCSGKVIANARGIWSSPHSDRQALLRDWQRRALQTHFIQLTNTMMEYSQQLETLRLLKTEPKVPIAAAAKIIGCTTTSAAKNRDILAQIRPTIVVVEEAAEILEASILSCLGPSVRHLIMVGDHKQLRPKLECYDLRKESGKGHDFDISLFERLAESSGFPIITLNEQRRMRPEICDMIRQTTYPSLKDHPSVTNREPILGISSNVVFLDHNHAEGADTENAVLGTSSKINNHEVGMVREIVHYFMLQGYSAGDIVVLTPYLGQLVLIQAELRKIKLKVDINDLDQQELQSADIDIGAPAVGSSADKSEGTVPTIGSELGVRVATVDNFQGEEAKIIIGSLVRCNDRSEIGFVSGAERVNVLLSRSRDAVVLLGSSTTLCSARRREGQADWTKIIDFLRQRGQVFQGFPAVCSAHKSRPDKLIDTPEKFAIHSPCGGCTRVCSAPLQSCPVGHLCTSSCHPALDPVTKADVHRTMPCRLKLQEQCKNGHEVKRECCATKGSLCREKVSAKCSAGLHSTEQFCYENGPKDCFPCKNIAKRKAKEAEKLVQEAVQQEAIIAKQREDLIQVQAELSRVEQEEDHTQRLERLQIEQKNMEDSVKEKKKAGAAARIRHKTALQSSLPSYMDGPAMEVPEDFLSTSKVNTKRIARPARTDNPSVNEPNSKLSSDSLPSSPPLPPVMAAPNRKPVPVRVGPAPPAIPTDSPPVPPAPAPVRTRVEAKAAPSSARVPANSKVNPPRSLPAAPASLSEKSASVSPALDRLKAVLKHADAGEWMKICQLPALRGQQNSVDDVDAFAAMAVQAVGMIADDQIQPAGDASTNIKKIDALILEFDGLNEVCESGSVDDALVHVVHAVLKYAKFRFYAKDSDFQHSAKRATEEYVFLLQLNARQELFIFLPKAWRSSAEKFKPSALKSQPTQVFQDPNCAAARWEHCKEDFRKTAATNHKGTGPVPTTPSEAVDTLMKLTGLESVKAKVVDMYERIVISRLQNIPPTGASYNIRCDGNPGTGKTTVARLYAAFLAEVGILSDKCEMKETSGSKLITDGVRGLTTMLEAMKENEGGVIFVDETYQLNPATDNSGRQVLDFILPLAEKLNGAYGKLVWIFAGYAKRMDKLYEHNEGLPSRFPYHLVFEDYTDAELLSIMSGLMQRGGQEVAAPVKKAPAVVKKKPATSIPVNQNNLYGAYGYWQQSQPDTTDQWGNVWSWNAASFTWEDSYDNITGTGVSNLGTSSNPLICRKDNAAWLYNSQQKLWSRQDDPSAPGQSWYPGSPPPKAPIKPPTPFTADPKWVRVAICRLGRSRGKVGFGNARAVRNLFEQSHSRQTKRLSALRREDPATLQTTNVMEFVRDDLLGPKASAESLKTSCPAWKTLESLTGLKEVKESLEKLVQLAVINSDLEDAEMPLRGVALNRIFLGNPGTGKTTVAALYGQILCHLGLLSKGEVVLKNSSDFIGNVIGVSEGATRSILAASEGCVLVIDEAYSLNPSPGSKIGGLRGTADPYKTGVVDTIVEQVQGRPGEDRAVVMLGYRKEMEDFLANANPGLARRFQMVNAFEFVDYTDEQLVTILLSKCAADKLAISVPTACYAIKQLARARSMPNFGNAGAVDTLLSEAKLNMGSRQELVNTDFHKGGIIPVHVEESTLFDDLVGCDSIRKELKGIQSTIKLARKKGRDTSNAFETNYLFVGAPGTGKTTVARKMGQMFHSLGLLPTSDVVEIKPADLAAVCLGQSAHKASEVIRTAKGKVLFIDEAYQLKGNQYMQEAVDTLVQELTSEELKGKLVVILAGYENEIDAMLQSTNPGLRSRFSKKLHFEDFTPEIIEEMLRAEMEKEDLRLSEEASDHLFSTAEGLTKIPEFSNGRDAKTLASRIRDAYAIRVEDCEDDPDVEVEDLDAALLSMQMSRKKSKKATEQVQISNSANVQIPSPQAQTQFAFAPPPPPIVVATATQRMASAASPTLSVEEDFEMVGNVLELTGGFGSGSTEFLKSLQNLLDEQGLNTKEGVAGLTRADPDGAYLLQLATRIAELLGIDLEEARDLLREWQANQLDVEDQVREQEIETAKAKKEKRKALLPIWRCAVCGRADLPYIYCYVSPYIVEYRECDV